MEQLSRNQSQHHTDRRRLEPGQGSLERRATSPARNENLRAMGRNPREWPDSTSRASEAKARLDKRAMEKTRQALKRSEQAIEATKQAMEKTRQALKHLSSQARLDKQAMEKTRQDMKTTIQDWTSRLNQALQDKQPMEKIIQDMEKTRQHLNDRLNQALQDKHAMDKTIRDMEKIIPCLNRLLNQAPQDKRAMEKTRKDMEKTMQDLVQEVNEICTKGENWQKKILVLFTGGTIGSVRLPKGEIVQPSEARARGFDAKDTESLLLDEHKKKCPAQYLSTIFETKTLMETLSENITTKKREELTKKLKEIDFEKYDGIVLTHGSDTLGHTANYLSMILAGIKVPMILVSSNYVVTDKRANGIENFKSAVDFISNVKLPGVYVTDNSHSKEKTKVIYASRVTQCKPITDNYGSTSIGEEGEKNMRPLGVIKDGKFEILDKKLFKKLQKRRQVERNNLLDKIEALNSRILVIHPHVGLNYDDFNLDNVDAILHTTYHSGTSCTDADSESENLLAFDKKCKQKGVDL